MQWRPKGFWHGNPFTECWAQQWKPTLWVEHWPFNTLWAVWRILKQDNLKNSLGHFHACFAPYGFTQVLGASRAHRNDVPLSYSDSTPSAHPLPASDDNRALNLPPRELHKETTLSCDCFCKATCRVSAALGHSLLTTNRPKRALQSLSENIPGESKSQGNRLLARRKPGALLPSAQRHWQEGWGWHLYPKH